MPIVTVDNVTLKFKLEQNRANSLKEFCVRWLRHDLKSTEFSAEKPVSDDGADGRWYDSFFVSHSLEQIREMCNKVLWLEHGVVQDFGYNELVCSHYLGESHAEEH